MLNAALIEVSDRQAFARGGLDPVPLQTNDAPNFCVAHRPGRLPSRNILMRPGWSKPLATSRTTRRSRSGEVAFEDETVSATEAAFGVQDLSDNPAPFVADQPRYEPCGVVGNSSRFGRSVSDTSDR
jgi:hypothetical protein